MRFARGVVVRVAEAPRGACVTSRSRCALRRPARSFGTVIAQLDANGEDKNSRGMPEAMKQRGFWKLDDVSDEQLVADLKGLLAADGRVEARIVAHLAELDTRRLHLRGAPSLFEYCQKRLGLSDNQAYFRITAARVARRFPVVFELLERREIHLTSVALLSKYLTEENHRELLSEAQSLSKRELLRALARRAPRPDAPNRLRKLPPRAGAVSAGPTGTLEALSETAYRLQLDTSPALKEKLELARDLMSHANPTGDLAIVIERGLDLLIAKLQQRRFGQTSRPGQRQRTASRGPVEQLGQSKSDSPESVAHLDRSESVSRSAIRVTKGAIQHSHESKPPRPVVGGPDQLESAGPKLNRSALVASQRQGGKTRDHIPHETRRQLVARDGLCCSYVGDDGQRCGSKAFLQVHHDRAWAKGGPDTLDNLRLFCAAHNRLQAEQEFGAALVQSAIEQRRGRVA